MCRMRTVHEILIVPLRQQSMEPFCWVKHLWAQHLHDTKDPAWLRMGIQDEKAKGCRAVRLTALLCCCLQGRAR